jgi:chromosome segregation ATPase
MKSMGKDVLDKLRKAERRLEKLSQECERLEAEKQEYLKEIMRGSQLYREVEKADEAMKGKRLAISKAKEEVSSLRTQLEVQLTHFKKDLIEEKKKDLNSYMEERARYLRRIEALEIEISRYRYLVTGKKDRRLANVKDLLPSEIQPQDEFMSIDEAIGRIKLEVHRITRMSSEALLGEYRARVKNGDKTKSTSM